MKINVRKIEKVAKDYLNELANVMQNDKDFVWEVTEAISDIAEQAGYSLDDLWIDLDDNDYKSSGLLYLIDEILYGMSKDMGIYEVWN